MVFEGGGDVFAVAAALVLSGSEPVEFFDADG